MILKVLDILTLKFFLEDSNILSKKFYELSGKWKELENDSKPAFRKYKLQMFEQMIRTRDFKETFDIVQKLDYATDDVLKVLFEYVKSTQKDYKVWIIYQS